MPAPRAAATITLIGLTLAAGVACADEGSTGDGWILSGVLGREDPGSCDGHEPGERWAVACNTCACESDGQAVCTRLDCNARDASALGDRR